MTGKIIRCFFLGCSLVFFWRGAEAADEATKFRILLTNDDGIRAEGLIALAKEIRTLDAEVTVVAPAEDQSGMSHALTYRDPFRVDEVRSEKGELFGYSVNGTPADSALLGMKVLMAEHPPNLVISGINRGENLGAVAHLSGTVGAAMEATTLGIPAIAISMGRAQPMDYSYAAKVAKRIALAVRQHGLPKGTCLNVNVPGLPEKQVKGVVVIAQSDWRGEIRHERQVDLFNRPYFWRGFTVETPKMPPDTDVGAFSSGYVTVTPIKVDWTDQSALSEIEKWGVGGKAEE
jgi:5'-nucleotidase